MNKIVYMITIPGIALGITLFAVQSIMAGQWEGPGSSRPATDSVSSITASNRDGLGQQVAVEDLNMDGNRIANVGSQTGDWALAATSSNAGITIDIDAGSGHSAEFISNSATYGAEIINEGTGLLAGIGVQTESAGSVSTYIADKLNVTDGIQLGNNSFNILATTPGSDPPSGDLYWGNTKICDRTRVDCGRTATASGDNLGVTGAVGSHTAQSDLNLNNNKITNIKYSNELLAIDATNTGAGYALNVSSNYRGMDISSNLSGFGSATPSSLYAHNAGAGYALSVISASGEAALMKGRVTLGQSDGLSRMPEVIFQIGANSLRIVQSAVGPPDPMTAELYWGDKLLCDGSQLDCGFGPATPGFDMWSLESDGDLFSDKFVSIGGPTERKAKLEVMPPNDATFAALKIVGDGMPDKSKIVIQGDKLYLLWVDNNVTSELKIYDISDKSNTSKLGEIQVYADGTASDIEVSGNYAYITNRASGVDLQVFDVSNPAAIAEVLPRLSWGASSTESGSIDIAGHYAMVVNQDRVVIVDIADTNLDAGDIVSNTTAGMGALSSLDSVMAGNHLYVANGSDNVSIIDVSDIDNPVIASTFATPSGWAKQVLVRGNILYVAASTSSAHFYTYDVTDPTAPQLLGSLALTKAIYDMSMAGHFIYAVGQLGDDNIQVIDISDPAVPVVQVINTVLDGSSIIVAGGYAYVSGDGAELNTIMLDGANAVTLNAGMLESDNIYSYSGISTEDNMYVGRGLGVGGNMTIGSGNLATSGYVQIGDQILTEQLLCELLEWLGEPVSC